MSFTLSLDEKQNRTIILVTSNGQKITYKFPYHNLLHNNIIGIQDLGDQNIVGLLSYSSNNICFNRQDNNIFLEQQYDVKIIRIKYNVQNTGIFHLGYIFSKQESYTYIYSAAPTVLIMDKYYECSINNKSYPIYPAITTVCYRPCVNFADFSIFPCVKWIVITYNTNCINSTSNIILDDQYQYIFDRTVELYSILTENIRICSDNKSLDSRFDGIYDGNMSIAPNIFNPYNIAFLRMFYVGIAKSTHGYHEDLVYNGFIDRSYLKSINVLEQVIQLCSPEVMENWLINLDKSFGDFCIKYDDRSPYLSIFTAAVSTNNIDIISLIIERGYKPNNLDVFYTVLKAKPDVLQYLLCTKFLYYIDFTLNTELDTLFDISDKVSLLRENSNYITKTFMLNINVLSLIILYVEHLVAKNKYDDNLHENLISNFKLLLSFGAQIEDFGYGDKIGYDIISKIREIHYRYMTYSDDDENVANEVRNRQINSKLGDFKCIYEYMHLVEKYENPRISNLKSKIIKLIYLKNIEIPKYYPKLLLYPVDYSR